MVGLDFLKLTVSDSQDTNLTSGWQQVFDASKNGFCSLGSDTKLDVNADELLPLTSIAKCNRSEGCYMRPFLLSEGLPASSQLSKVINFDNLK